METKSPDSAVVNSKLMEINSVLFRSFFAHHPNCDQYDHHVLTVGKWRFCLGCTGMYFGIILATVIDLVVLPSAEISSIFRFGLGLLFFIPAVIQLFWKSRRKPVKFLMRFSLGFAIWCILSAIYFYPNIYFQLLGVVGFVVGVRLYSIKQAETSLIECENCKYDQEYHSCLVKHQDLLNIPQVGMVRHEHEVIQRILALRDRMEEKDALPLPLREEKST